MKRFIFALVLAMLAGLVISVPAQATEIPVTCSFYLGEPYLAGHPAVNWHQRMEIVTSREVGVRITDLRTGLVYHVRTQGNPVPVAWTDLVHKFNIAPYSANDIKIEKRVGGGAGITPWVCQQMAQPV